MVRQPGMNHMTSIVYTVTDLAAATSVHAAVLGVAPHTDQPYYVGFSVGDLDIALVPHDPAGDRPAPVAFVHVDDLESAITLAEAAGATVAQQPRDAGGGTRLATVTDGGGNVVGLISRSGDDQSEAINDTDEHHS
ncbi:MAG: VOC family protein [Ilumatobacteraceae bacterium]